MSMPYTKLEDQFNRLGTNRSPISDQPMRDYLASFNVLIKGTFQARINRLPPEFQEELKCKLSDEKCIDAVSSAVMEVPVTVKGELMDIYTAFKLLKENEPAVTPQNGYEFFYQDLRPAPYWKGIIETEISAVEDKAKAVFVSSSSSNSSSDSNDIMDKRKPMLEYLDSFKKSKGSFESRALNLSQESERMLKNKNLMDSVTLTVMNIPVSVHGELMDLVTALKLLKRRPPRTGVTPQKRYTFEYKNIEPAPYLKQRIEEIIAAEKTEMTITENEAITSSSSSNSSHTAYNVSSAISQHPFTLDKEVIMKLNAYPPQLELAKVEYELGFMYKNGCGVPQNNVEAKGWLTQAARDLALLGYYYEKGDGVPHDRVKAIICYRFVVTQEHDAEVLYRLASLLKTADPVMPPNLAEASQYFYEAVKTGNRNWSGLAASALREMAQNKVVEAKFRLGLLYRDGSLGSIGIPPELDTAAKYFYEAATQGLERARLDLIGMAEKEGLRQAAFYLGVMYRGGMGVLQNNTEAVKYFGQAANARCEEAVQKLYEMAHQGDAEALNELDKIAAIPNNSRAQIKLALLYIQEGQNVPPNPSKALEYYAKIISPDPLRNFRPVEYNEYRDVSYLLGMAYKNGRGVPKNDGEALKYFKKAADLYHIEACFILGEAYYKGCGVPKNFSISAEYLANAICEKPEARQMLELIFSRGYAPPLAQPTSTAVTAAFLAWRAKQMTNPVSQSSEPSIPAPSNTQAPPEKRRRVGSTFYSSSQATMPNQNSSASTGPSL